MFKSKYNPKLKNIKFETSEEAIARGVKITIPVLDKKGRQVKKKTKEELLAEIEELRAMQK